jgi:hypothetical protein
VWPWNLCSCQQPAGIQIARLAGVIQVPAGVVTETAPEDGYTI